MVRGMDIENTMRFILDMQAKHEAAIQRHNEAMARHDAAIGHHDAAIGQHDAAILRIDGAVEANTTRIGQLVDVCLPLAHSVEQTNASVNELREAMREAQAATDYKLSALIDTVEKLVGNGHKGG
jgi:chromosome segregation ATPase